jgi:hypothetical protein
MLQRDFFAGTRFFAEHALRVRQRFEYKLERFPGVAPIFFGKFQYLWEHIH